MFSFKQKFHAKTYLAKTRKRWIQSNCGNYSDDFPFRCVYNLLLVILSCMTRIELEKHEGSWFHFWAVLIIKLCIRATLGHGKTMFKTIIWYQVSGLTLYVQLQNIRIMLMRYFHKLRAVSVEEIKVTRMKEATTRRIFIERRVLSEWLPIISKFKNKKIIKMVMQLW